MRCSDCHRNIQSGMEADKRIEFWRQDDGSLIAFGANMDAGPCGAATGSLESAKHQKCYWIMAKRERRAIEPGPADPEEHQDPHDWRLQFVADAEELSGSQGNAGSGGDPAAG